MERDSPLGRSLGRPLRARSHYKREPEAPAEGIVPRHQGIPVDRSRALRLTWVSTRIPPVKTRLTLVSGYKCDSIGVMRYARAQHVSPHRRAEKPKPGTHSWSGIIPSDGASVSRCARDRITNERLRPRLRSTTLPFSLASLPRLELGPSENPGSCPGNQAYPRSGKPTENTQARSPNRRHGSRGSSH